MASAIATLHLLDLPEVQQILQDLRELALTHCHGCDDEGAHRQDEMAKDGFKPEFIDGCADISSA